MFFFDVLGSDLSSVFRNVSSENLAPKEMWSCIAKMSGKDMIIILAQYGQVREPAVEYLEA